MWLCDVCVSLQHNKGCQASGFLFASLLCYHSPVSPNFLSHRMQITRLLFREVFGFCCVFFLFLFCGKLHKGACILTAVSYSTLLCNRSKAVGDTVTCLFCSNQGRSVNTATLVLHSLKTKTTVWLVPSNDDTSPPPRVDFDPFPTHSRQVVLSFVPFHIRSIIKTQITELCWNWSWNVP